MGTIYYETAPMPQTDGTNIVVNGDGKLDLGTNITTKLSKVDTPDNLSVELAKKINKPASATNGQVLTYNGTSNEWEAQDSKGGSITEPTDLEKGIIGGDEWVSGGSYTIGESVVIDENKLYLLVGDGGSTTKPSTDTTHSIWEETSISTLNSKVNSSLQWKKVTQDISSLSTTSTERKTLTIPELVNAKEVLTKGSFGTCLHFIFPTDYIGTMEQGFSYTPISTYYRKSGNIIINNETGQITFEVGNSGGDYKVEIIDIWYK